MSEYAECFAENDVDLSVLPHLTDHDLKELGVSLGHRRKMLAAIAERTGAVEAPPRPTSTETKPSDTTAERRAGLPRGIGIELLAAPGHWCVVQTLFAIDPCPAVGCAEARQALDVAPAAAAWREGGRDYHRGIARGICDGPPQVSSIPPP
jgi:hypothetical protein